MTGNGRSEDDAGSGEADPRTDVAGSTQLGARRAPSAATPRPGATDGTALGRRADGPGMVRFGPGLPEDAAVPPPWSSPTRPGAGTARRRRRRRPWVGALITLVLVAGALAYLLTRGTDPVTARAQEVTAGSGTCDAVVDVVGTIATNGRPGSVSYQWVRSDGQPTSVLTQSVSRGATTAQVHLQWAFSGRGRYQARATLRVLDPPPTSEASGAFTYSCP